jgi:hypothetical protein
MVDHRPPHLALICRHQTFEWIEPVAVLVRTSGRAFDHTAGGRRLRGNPHRYAREVLDHG